MAQPGAVMLNWCNVAPEHRPAYYQWHGREHMVGRLRLPGFLRGRRYAAIAADREFFNFYEIDRLETLAGPDYMAAAANPSALTRATSVHLTDAIRGLTRVAAAAGTGVGGVLLTLRAMAREGAETVPPALLDHLGKAALAGALADGEICAARLCVSDLAASRVVTPERANRPPAAVPLWVVMIEGFSAAAVERAADRHFGEKTLETLGAGAVSRGTFALQLVTGAADIGPAEA